MEEFQYGLKELRFIVDPGHGWLEVPTADVEASGYQPSRYSRVSDALVTSPETAGCYTYLEEDCDVAGFVQALGVAPELVAPTVSYISYYTRTDYESFVRELPHCSGAGFVSPFGRV